MKTAVRVLLLAALLALTVTAGTVVARQFRDDPTGCEWQWTGTQWVLEDFNCPGGVSGCKPPTRAGEFVGQTVYNPCVTTPPSLGVPCGCGQ
jgi:hypothetical protein